MKGFHFILTFSILWASFILFNSFVMEGIHYMKIIKNSAPQVSGFWGHRRFSLLLCFDEMKLAYYLSLKRRKVNEGNASFSPKNWLLRYLPHEWNICLANKLINHILDWAINGIGWQETPIPHGILSIQIQKCYVISLSSDNFFGQLQQCYYLLLA